MLRPYQNDLVEQVRQAYRDGYRRPCIVLGCGGGKSVIMAEIAKQTTAKGNRVLLLVHRRELCGQIEETFRSWGVDMSLCQVCMVQTAVRRLGRIPQPALIITDENHHCLAGSYRRIYDAFPGARCLGMTATPVRLGGGGLGDVNDKLIIGPTTRWLIDNGYLAPYDYYAPPVADLTGLHTNRGEYVVSEVEQRLIKRAVFGDVIGYYRRLALGRQAICYCASVAHSKHMEEAWRGAGIAAAHIDGETPTQERAEIIQKFRRGEITILCNVDLVSEGFDVPDCGVSILLRPTKSLTLYIQQAMRCMRYQPNKRAVIIDHVGNYVRFGLPDMEREWELTPKKKKQGGSDTEFKVRQCPICFFTHETGPACPECGYVYPLQQRTLEEIKEAKLEQVRGIVLDYAAPDQCRTMPELIAFGKRKGYKPGWAYYYGKKRGIV